MNQPRKQPARQPAATGSWPYRTWEVYVKWFPDEVIGLYCAKCGLALTDASAIRKGEWTFTVAKLTEMIKTHLHKSHRGVLET